MTPDLKNNVDKLIGTVYKEGGKLFMIDGYTENGVMLSHCINHTPNSKYTGEMLRKIRAEKGV